MGWNLRFHKKVIVVKSWNTQAELGRGDRSSLKAVRRKFSIKQWTIQNGLSSVHLPRATPLDSCLHRNDGLKTADFCRTLYACKAFSCFCHFERRKKSEEPRP